MMAKTMYRTAGLAIALMLLSAMGVTAAMAASVIPETYDPWQSGDAKFECGQLVPPLDTNICNYSYKIDNWGDNRPNDGPYEVWVDSRHVADIVISNDDGYTFDWELVDADTSDNIVYYMCAVIVKGSNKANVFFYYQDKVTSDTDLYAPLNDRSPDPNDTYAISHATFCFRQEIVEREIKYYYETAYAYSTNAIQFIPTFSNWGWTIQLGEEGTYTFDVYAGAGQCDITKGMLVGTVEVTYSGGTVTVNFDLGSNDVADFTLEEFHVYAGYTPFPTFKGKQTVAPGQYTVGTGLSGTIYVIVHAVVGIPYYA